MKILLVRPKPDPKTINLQSFMICEPLELEYLSAYLEEGGHKTEIVDMLIEKRDLMHFVRDFAPDIVAFTAYLPHLAIVKAYAAEVKAYDRSIVTVVGGVHADVRPQDLADANIDCVASRNGMRALRAIADGKGFAEAQACEPDSQGKFPFPDREKTARYRSHYNYVFHNHCASIKTSRGCPYNCDFCFCVRIAEGKYSCRDLTETVDEIETIKEKNVFIVDDDFLVDRNRITEFCRLIKERGIDKRYILFSRVDFVAANPDIITLLKGIGLHAVFMGFESFSQKDLDSYNKKVEAEENIKAVQILEKEGILPYLGIMVGSDWERSDFDGLIANLRKFKYPMVNIQPVTPIPGTPLYERMESQVGIGLDRAEIWDMAHVIVKPGKLSEKAFYREILRAYMKVSLLPRVQWMVVTRFGFGAYFRALKGAYTISGQYRKLAREGAVFNEEKNTLHTANNI